MGWWMVFTQVSHVKGVHEEFQGIIPARDALRARDKARRMWHRKVLRVERANIRVKERDEEVETGKRRGK